MRVSGALREKIRYLPPSTSMTEIVCPSAISILLSLIHIFCEYDQQVKHYPEKRGIVHNEILLPANAPPEYADRNTLWNAAEAVEKQWNSQLARRWVLTIPRERCV